MRDIRRLHRSVHESHGELIIDHVSGGFRVSGDVGIGDGIGRDERGAGQVSEQGDDPFGK